MKIGVLALQGAFEKHQHILKKLEIETAQIRYPKDLLGCSGLILPGGESTVMWRLMEKNNLLDPLKNWSFPMFGTCAGLIIMTRLGLLDITCERNGYGRQSASFMAELSSSLGNLTALFIRAPRIKEISQSVEILASYQNEPVLIQQGPYMASTFHPELTNDTKVHSHFLTFSQANAEKS